LGYSIKLFFKKQDILHLILFTEPFESSVEHNPIQFYRRSERHYYINDKKVKEKPII
jgi:hypothetical protein